MKIAAYRRRVPFFCSFWYDNGVNIYIYIYIYGVKLWGVMLFYGMWSDVACDVMGVMRCDVIYVMLLTCIHNNMCPGEVWLFTGKCPCCSSNVIEASIINYSRADICGVSFTAGQDIIGGWAHRTGGSVVTCVVDGQSRYGIVLRFSHTCVSGIWVCTHMFGGSVKRTIPSRIVL